MNRMSNKECELDIMTNLWIRVYDTEVQQKKSECRVVAGSSTKALSFDYISQLTLIKGGRRGILFKKRQQGQNGVTYVKPHVTKPRLSCSFFPRNGILNQSTKNRLISTKWGNLPAGPLPSSRKVTLQQPTRSLPNITSLSPFPSAYKSSISSSFMELLSMLPDSWITE